jgi:hypothetical protein
VGNIWLKHYFKLAAKEDTPQGEARISFYLLYRKQPMYGPILPDGSGRYTNSVFPSVQTPNKNPIAIAQNAINKQNDYYVQSSFYLNIHLIKRFGMAYQRWF